MKKRVLIWGSGAVYNQHLNILRYMVQAGEFNVIGVVANLFAEARKLDDYHVIQKSMISTTDFDYIIVMSDMFYQEIVEEAVSLGVHREQILPYRILDIPYMDFDKYIKLKTSQVSIISNNCWGGTVYCSLGMECLSPFKNLFLEDEDYIRLLSNLRDYLSMPLKFVGFGTDIHSRKQYPIMGLGDIFVHCNHEDAPEDALEKWNRRLKKINYDNLFVEMYTENKHIADEFVSMGQYDKKICFVPYETQSSDMIQLELYPGQKEFYEVVNSNAAIGKNSNTYSLIDLMLGNKRMRVEI